MLILQVLLLVAGLVALVIGYRKHNRNLMMAAALVLLVAGSVWEFVSGFNASRAQHQAP
ncbi:MULTISPECIES: hypothetical protein [Luteimonas]|uniref:hypothetical protein n=1 Tax=Luteimonas TaxID=83614 RepID=UPI0018EC40F0|nr:MULTISPECIES: hypothetical protein [Luteimonas]